MLVDELCGEFDEPKNNTVIDHETHICDNPDNIWKLVATGGGWFLYDISF